MKVVQFEWAEFLREFDRQSAAEGTEHPKHAIGPDTEHCEEEETLCACFNHQGKEGECHAHQCTNCRLGCSHEVGSHAPSKLEHIVPAVCDEEPTCSKTLRLNGSHTQFADEQYPSTSNGVREQPARRQRAKRAREAEKPMTNGYSHENGVEFSDYYSDNNRRVKNSQQQTEIDTPVVDARKTKAVNGKGKGSFSPETIDLTGDDDVVVIDTQHITARKTKRVRSPIKSRTAEIGMYEHQMEEIAEDARRNPKKRNAQKPMSPYFEQKRFSQMRTEEDQQQPGHSGTNGLVNGHCAGPSTSYQKSPLRSPRYSNVTTNRERNGWHTEELRSREDARNHNGFASSQHRPSPTTQAEPFFQNAFHTKERWRRSSDVGGDGHSFEPVALTTPPQSFLSPQRELRHLIDPLMSPLAEEAERPKQNGKVNGQRNSFRNARKPTEKATKPMGFHLYQTLVRHRRESVGSDTLLTPPLPADETDSAILGPLALRPPDTYSLEDGVSVQPFLMSPGLNLVSPLGSPGFWSPNRPKAPSPIPPYSPLSLVIPEKTNGMVSPSRDESLLLAVQVTVSPKKMNGVREHEVEECSEGPLELLSETELMPHLEENGLPNIDAIMDFGGLTHENIHEEYRIKITIPRVIVTPMDTMFRIVTNAIRKRLQEMYAKAKPLSKNELRAKLDTTFKHTKCIHDQLKMNWDTRLRLPAGNNGNGTPAYRRPLNPLWRMVQNQQAANRSNSHQKRWDKNPHGWSLPPEQHGADLFFAPQLSDMEYGKILVLQEEKMVARKAESKQKRTVDWVRKDIMYLEQMLPHVSTDRQHHETEARRQFQTVPDSFKSIRDGVYWIPSQKLHNMVATAIRYRVERDRNNAVTIYFLLKDWNELRIHYEDKYRLPRDVLVTLSPYRAIAPAVEKNPGGRFRTQLTGTLDLN